MKKRNLVRFGVGLFSLALLAGCSTTTNKGSSSSDGGSGDLAEKQEVNLTVPQEMPSADLSLATDTISFTALNNIYEGIYRLDKDNVPQPAGAEEKAKVSEDGLTYTVKLRKEAKWSNGDPVTAKDYVFSWQRAVDPKTASEYSYLFAPVLNASEITEGKKDKKELGIKAVDDYTLEVKLATPAPYFDYLFAFPTFFPQNEKVYKEQGANYAKKSENSVYNGPFKLDGFDGPGVDTEWTYAKNDTYWDAKEVKLTSAKVTVVKDSSTGLNLYDAGKADDVLITGEQAQQKAGDPGFQSVKEARTSYIEFNQYKGKNAKAWKNANLRKAISFAIDREGLVNNVLGDGSVSSTSIIPKDMSFEPKTKEDFTKEVGDQCSFDKEQAKEYWEKAKKELGISSLDINMIGSDDDSVKKTMQKIQADIQDALPDVKVSVSPVPFSVRLERSSSGDFDTVLGGWGADYTDPSSFTDLFVTGNSYNRGHYSNTEYDKLVKDTATTHANDPEKRWDDFKKATDVLVKDDMGIVPVFQRAEGHMINPKVKGIVHHGAGANWDYKWTYVEK